MVDNLKLIIASFTASAGFGIVFHIKKELLFWAGLGGALTRLCFLILMELIDARLVYTLLAAMFAALYAEVMAMEFKTPSTVFLYPAVSPLLPGGLMYHAAINFLLQDIPAMRSYLIDCALSVTGTSIGLVVISTFTYYRRLYFAGKHLASHLLQYESAKHKKK